MLRPCCAYTAACTCVHLTQAAHLCSQETFSKSSFQLVSISYVVFLLQVRPKTAPMSSGRILFRLLNHRWVRAWRWTCWTGNPSKCAAVVAGRVQTGGDGVDRLCVRGGGQLRGGVPLCRRRNGELLFPGDLLGKIQEFDEPLSIKVMADGVWRKTWEYADKLQLYFKK